MDCPDRCGEERRLHAVETLDEASVINARWFGWDGPRLGFFLTADTATPPPSPNGG
jgi:hypothetical protein